MSHWLVTGAGGMLGWDLVAGLKRRGEDVAGLTRQDLDITHKSAVDAALRRLRPAVVVNCAAWTAVDEAEEHEGDALQVNGHGAEYIAAACANHGARMFHISTDYVFSGDAQLPYSEQDAVSPRTAYGRTKLVGERAVLQQLPGTGYVVRTAWLYGVHGPNFVRTMISLERERPSVDVVDDQFGQPTWTADVTGRIIALVHSGATAGVYHATSSGGTTWFGLAREVFQLLGADPDRVRPVTSSAYQRPAPRPGYSVLGHQRWAAAGMRPIGDWRLALRRAFPLLVSESS
jgi:dTDP-4-dehydrorhamnose reductase